MFDRRKLRAIFRGVQFSEDAGSDLVRTLKAMQQRFLDRRHHGGFSDGGEEFRKRLREYARQLAPLIRKEKRKDRSRFVLLVFTALNEVDEILKAKAYLTPERERQLMRIQRELLFAAQKIMRMRGISESKFNSEIAQMIASPVTPECADLLSSLVPCLRFSLSAKKKRGPSANLHLTNFLARVFFEMRALMPKRRFQIGCLANMFGDEDRRFFEQHREPKATDGQFYVSPVRLVANGLYLAGIDRAYCNERSLRYSFAGM